MDKIIRPIKNFCIVYVDDIRIHSKNLKEHIEHLKKFNYIARKYELVLSERKVEIVKTEIEFLGYIFAEEKIIHQPHIGKKIIDFSEEIRDKKELQNFIRLLNYSEKFIKNCAKYKVHFTKKLKKGVEWEWTQEDIEIINKIKRICENISELNILNDEDFFILETDASLLHWGAILKRKENHKEFLCNLLCKCPEELVVYTSGTFKDAETHV